ncbi:MAG: FKBP-type peptidyl-prolyl cis-trans isomerase [Bacteroidota bacterium]
MRSLSILVVAVLLAACGSEPDIGDGPDSVTATPSSTVTIDYRGTLRDGTVFDENDGVTYPLRNFVPGFRDAVNGMQIGETKTFEVPPDQGYGDRPPPGIPPGDTLIFGVTLRDIE